LADVNGNLDGITPNDFRDLDTGPNGLQNYPVLTSAVASGTNVTIKGNPNSIIGSDFFIEVFDNPSCDSSGSGEGQFLIGVTSVTTDFLGDATIASTFSASVPVGDFITVTATDTLGNTSEFSPCV